MRIHAIFCIGVGLVCILLPHSIFTHNDAAGTHYSHLAHEYIRLYGCLTLCLGWLIERCKTITDGALIRIFSEVFCICYALHSIVMVRAHLTNPGRHMYIHMICALLFVIISVLYGCVRLLRKPKEFELPSQMRDN